MTDLPNPKEELAILQAELSSRSSILHLAHAVVSFALAFIFTGATIQLVRVESIPNQYFVGAAAGALTVYAAVRAWLGRRALVIERVRFARMQDLRRSMKLDDPSALLPQ